MPSFPAPFGASRRAVLAAGALSLLPASGGARSAPRDDADALAANKRLALRMYGTINGRDLAAFDAFVAADYVQHAAGVPQGRDGLKQAVSGFYAAFPDLLFTPQAVVAQGDLVAARAILSGTHDGDFFGIPASGRFVTVQDVNLWRVTDGMLVEHWEVLDLLGLMQQVGAVPAPDGLALPAVGPLGTLGAVGAGELAPVAPAGGDPAANTALVERFYAAFAAGDLAALGEVLDPAWIDAPPPPGTGADVVDIANSLGAFATAFPDLALTIEQTVAEGDLVVVRSVISGAHGGDFAGIPATGRAVAFEARDIHRVRDGRIVATWHLEDLAGAVQQLTAPDPAATATA